MMRLSMLPIVERTVAALGQIDKAVAAVELDIVQLSIEGVYQDTAMIARIRPVVLAELKGRRASLLRDLESYGVDPS